MKIELVKVERRPLPRYFPPGYFDWSFYLLTSINVANHIWCTVWAVYQASQGNTWSLLLMCAIEAANVMTTARNVRMLRRHSREWQQQREEIEKRMAEVEREFEKHAQDFAEFQRRRNEGQNEH
jgi:hypothetical protein